MLMLGFIAFALGREYAILALMLTIHVSGRQFKIDGNSDKPLGHFGIC
jgi:hypothetical protein